MEVKLLNIRRWWWWYDLQYGTSSICTSVRTQRNENEDYQVHSASYEWMKAKSSCMISKIAQLLLKETSYIDHQTAFEQFFNRIESVNQSQMCVFQPRNRVAFTVNWKKLHTSIIRLLSNNFSIESVNQSQMSVFQPRNRVVHSTYYKSKFSFFCTKLVQQPKNILFCCFHKNC